jgi:hypothetical protein
MGLFVSTVSADVALPKLGIVLVHPTTDYDLGSQFSGADLRRAVDLTTAITSGALTWKKTSGGSVQLAADYDPDWVEVEGENTGTGNQDDRAVTFKDLYAWVGATASPGWTWGRSGNVPNNTWLLNDTVPSNKAGRVVYLTSGVVKRVVVANEDASVFSLAFYHHDGNEVALTLLGTVTTTAVRSNSFNVSWAVPAGKQVAVKVSANSAKNVVVGALVAGTI